MSSENLDFETMYESVRRFRDLGTGRECKKVLVGNTDDARTSTFIFCGYISYNWPSWKQIGIKVDNHITTFDTATQTISGKPAYIFLWNELTQDLWYRQNERRKLLEWIEFLFTANPQDFIVIADLTVEQTESEYKVVKYPGLEKANLRPIQIEIMKLSTAFLRRLNSLMDVSDAKDSPKSLIAA